MRLIVNIDKEVYKAIKRPLDCGGHYDSKCFDAIWNGVPLPEGHGNLIQREDAETIFKNARKALLEQSRKEQIKDLQTRETMLLNAEQFIHLIHPIIEAESEE